MGRVLRDTSGESAIEEGLYVCGWLKRGPTGIIATNLYCAEETVSGLIEEVLNSNPFSSITCRL